MDRGMVSEKNLSMLRQVQASYIVGTPKSELKTFEQKLLEDDWEHVGPGVEVKPCAAPEGDAETFVLCRSEGRIQKEHAIREKQVKRIEAELDGLKTSIQAEKGALRNYSTAERRVAHSLRDRDAWR